MEATEKRFESDIEAAFLSPTSGYARGTDTYAFNLGPCIPIIPTASTRRFRPSVLGLLFADSAISGITTSRLRLYPEQFFLSNLLSHLWRSKKL